MCREILPRLGRRVDYRLVRFDPVTGELDLDHLASLIDTRTKLVCCTGASNFLGTRNPLHAVRALADASGYRQPSGERRSYLLVDGAQLVPGSFTDVQDLDVDFLAFSFHKMLAPFGIGVLYAKEHLLSSALPFLYGGDMIAEGRVSPDVMSSTTRCPGSTPLVRPTSSARLSRPRRCACCLSWRSRRTTPLISGPPNPLNAPLSGKP
jgi:cysteine desulfurase/selenocysteine lyase